MNHSSLISEADLERLLKLAQYGKLFTSPAPEIGISSGAWILLCDRYLKFDMLDVEL